ncbi:MAG: LapA family protein, partial [Amphiplicatus sp.]
RSSDLATLALPFWVWLALSLLIGVFAGAAGMWMSGRERRAKARAEHRELKVLKAELAAAQARNPETLPTLKAS